MASVVSVVCHDAGNVVVDLVGVTVCVDSVSTTCCKPKNLLNTLRQEK